MANDELAKALFEAFAKGEGNTLKSLLDNTVYENFAGAIRDASRVLAAMNAEVEHLTDLAEHWASRIEVGGIAPLFSCT